jgi:Surface-adhesin protein E
MVGYRCTSEVVVILRIVENSDRCGKMADKEWVPLNKHLMNRVLSFSLIVCIFFTCVIAEGSDWIPLGESNIGTAFYDRASIQQLSGNVIRVSVKYTYSSEGVKEFREAFPKVNMHETISYTLYVYDINCCGDSFRLIKAATYDSADSVIDGTELEFNETEQSTPEHITPNSMMEQLSEVSCRWGFYDPCKWEDRPRTFK